MRGVGTRRARSPLFGESQIPQDQPLLLFRSLALEPLSAVALRRRGRAVQGHHAGSSRAYSGQQRCVSPRPDICPHTPQSSLYKSSEIHAPPPTQKGGQTQPLPSCCTRRNKIAPSHIDRSRVLPAGYAARRTAGDGTCGKKNLCFLFFKFLRFVSLKISADLCGRACAEFCSYEDLMKSFFRQVGKSGNIEK